MNIIAYCRVSTDKDDQLNSLEAQKKFFQEYADKIGHNLIKIYADEGISGTKIKNRTQFLQMMRDAKHNLFEVVVVKDISRFARNTVDLLNATRELKALNIETTFLTANMSVLGNSEFVLTIFGALAQEESANTSKRVKFGKDINAKKGRVPNLVYGYDKIKGDYFNLNINEKEAQVVRRIFDLYLHSGHGCNKISLLLNEEGVKTKRDCKWNQNGVGTILTNAIYTGKIINHKTEVVDFLTSKRVEKDQSEWYIVDKPELRIISDEDFIKARKILQHRNTSFKLNKERQSNRHTFSTLIRCDCCGYSFRRLERQFKNTYIRWVCSGRNANGTDSCDNFVKLDEAELQDTLRAYFKQILENRTDTIQAIVSQFDKVYQSKNKNTDLEKELQQSLSKLIKKRQKSMDMYEDELITREELNGRIGKLNHEIASLENRIKLIDYNLTRGAQLEFAMEQTLQNIEKILNMEELDNVTLRSILNKIVVKSDGNVEIYLKLLSDIGFEPNVLVDISKT